MKEHENGTQAPTCPYVHLYMVVRTSLDLNITPWTIPTKPFSATFNMNLNQHITTSPNHPVQHYSTQPCKTLSLTYSNSHYDTPINKTYNMPIITFSLSPPPNRMRPLHPSMNITTLNPPLLISPSHQPAYPNPTQTGLSP